MSICYNVTRGSELMKKLFLLLTVFAFIILPLKVEAKDKVTIYMFRGYDCPHCEAALDYFYKNKDRIPKNVEIQTFEVWKNDNNSTLQDLVAERLGIDTEDDNYGIPFFVIGENYQIGFNSNKSEEGFEKIIAMAEENLNKDNYKDVIEEVLGSHSLNIEKQSLEEVMGGPSIWVTIIIYIIFGLMLVGLVALMFFSRK